MTTAAVESTKHKLPFRTLIAASAGNAVEWYDWTIYATFSIYFATQVFPETNETAAFIGVFAAYALSFFFRPLGGLLLGRFADVHGRKKAMMLTIVLMAGGSLLIALTPTFNAVSWLSPIILIVARIAQGMSLGGEVSNASAYLGEIAPPERRGRYSAFFYISTGSAVLLASLLGALFARILTEDQLASWGWRIPFVIGAGLGVVGMWLRRHMDESELFEEKKEEAQAVRAPLRTTLREYPKQVAQLVGLTLLGTLCYYSFFSAITPFAVKGKGIDAGLVFTALSIATAIFVLVQYPFGALSDRYGRKPQLLVFSGGVTLLIVPLSMLILPNFWALLLMFTTGLTLYALSSSLAPAVMSELFPTRVRALGIGAWYNLTVATFGGTAPLVIQLLTDIGHPNLFFWYVALAGAITFCTILTFTETKGKVLD